MGVAGQPGVAGAPRSTASGIAARTPSMIRSRKALIRSRSATRFWAADSAAAANAAIDAVSNVPERTSRSCPPRAGQG
ncbi:hypothetical protein AHiyo8_54640 [Arthrobacter sp. Hiyo8]|nr:hypothetical protein AHiyo8_54640 [Arthrobacter sp. Hiyo8]